ncbi:MAG: gamma-glutamyltransferase family protein [Pseudomonadota bacterium]
MDFAERLAYPSARSTAFGEMAVATSEPLAANAGLEVLAAGGNAVDAAIAAAAVLTITEPVSNGLGSDAFALVWDGQRVDGLNASGRAPRGWTPERFAGQREMPHRGWDTVTIPGAVSGWVALAQKYGSRPLPELLAPAVRYARQGYAVAPVVAGSWARQAGTMPRGMGFEAAFLPGGRPPVAGERFALAGAADALERIGETGGAAFYEGEIAEEIVALSAQGGGTHTVEDFASHRAEWVEPISLDACGLKIHEIPPNGQGIAALMALGMLEHMDLGDGPDDVRSLHAQIEAVKLSLADVYTHVGDADAMVLGSAAFLDPAYLRERAGLIDFGRAGAPATGLPRAGGTVLVTTADASGMMVSFIQSNYEGFGSGCVTPRFGISLQNRGSAFSLDPESPNCVGPGKRPFHTIIPALATRGGAPFMAFGMMGGPIQAQGHVQLVTRIARFGQSPQTAIDAPRFRVLQERRVAVEAHLPAAVRDGLAALGHEVVTEAPNVAFGFGGAQVIARHGGGYAAGSDPRKDGYAAVR